MPHLVRRATIEDALGIARVRVRSWQSGYAGLLPQDYLQAMDIAENARRTRARMSEGMETVADWVLETDGETVGWACTRLEARDHELPSSVAELTAIYVLPAYWGKGLGYVLMEAAIAHLQAVGASAVVLWVVEGNQRAQGFYERQGFRLDGGRKALGMFPERDIWEVRYSYSLQSRDQTG